VESARVTSQDQVEMSKLLQLAAWKRKYITCGCRALLYLIPVQLYLGVEVLYGMFPMITLVDLMHFFSAMKLSRVNTIKASQSATEILLLKSNADSRA